MTLRRQFGFSLMEMMGIIMIISMLAGIAVFTWTPVLNQAHVNTAYNETLTTLRRAHDQAAADMRVYVVSFTAPGTIAVTQTTPTGTPLMTMQLPTDVTFHVEPGIPTSPTVSPTTPDGFGVGSPAIDFDQPPASIGGGTTIYFYPDGTAEDANGNINNGVIYMARVGDLYSSRAITVWGYTGRIRGFRLYQNGSGAIWRQQ